MAIGSLCILTIEQPKGPSLKDTATLFSLRTLRLLFGASQRRATWVFGLSGFPALQIHLMPCLAETRHGRSQLELAELTQCVLRPPSGDGTTLRAYEKSKMRMQNGVNPNQADFMGVVAYHVGRCRGVFGFHAKHSFIQA